MLGIVLGTRVSRPTAKLIANLLGADYSENYLSATRGYRYIFRYGNSYTTTHMEIGNVWEINTARMVQLTSNKAQCRRLFLEHGISCPRLIQNEEELRNENYPLVARPFFHSRGKKFYLVESMRDGINFLHRGFYLQELILKRQEYRVFMYNGKFFECSKKEQGEDVRNLFIRNHRNGWIFNRILVNDFPESLKEECRKVYSTTRLGWMAIDCCFDSESKPYIFEANSAPGLLPRKAEKLVEKIKEDLRDYEVERIR